MKLTPVLALVSVLAPLAAAEDVNCCRSSYVPMVLTYQCEDNSQPDPCCAHGGCDARCCNCAGGCRVLHVERPKVHSNDDAMKVLEESLDQAWLARLKGYDKNGDGAATIEEIRDKDFRVPAPQGESHLNWFKKWDKDHNGVVHRQEGPLRPGGPPKSPGRSPKSPNEG